MNDRQKLLYQVELASLAERHNDMIVYVKKYVQEDGKLTTPELELLNKAYIYVLNNRRVSKMTLVDIEKQQRNNGDFKYAAETRKFIKKIEDELRAYCHEYAAIMHKNIIPEIDDVEIKMICYKTIGDFFNLLVDHESTEFRGDAIEKTEAAYSVAKELTLQMTTIHEDQFSLILNYSIFKYYDQKHHEQAMSMARSGYEDASTAMLKVDEKKKEAITSFMRKMMDYYIIWKIVATRRQIEERERNEENKQNGQVQENEQNDKSEDKVQNMQKEENSQYERNEYFQKYLINEAIKQNKLGNVFESEDEETQ